MSGVTAMGVLAGAAAVGTAYSVVQGEKAEDAQKDAMRQQQSQADAALKAQESAQAQQLSQANEALKVQQSAYAAQLAMQQEAMLSQQSQSAAMIQTIQQQATAQERAMANQLALQKQNFAQQEQQINRANQRSPDSSAILSGNQRAARGGQSGTMLTGVQGIDPNKLALGKNTLLGS